MASVAGWDQSASEAYGYSTWMFPKVQVVSWGQKELFCYAGRMEISYADKKHLARAKKAGNKRVLWTKEDILDAIREADAAGIKTSPEYQTWASQAKDRPSFRTITSRYGSWMKVRQEAGFAPTRGGWTRKTTNQQHLDAVVRCARELGKLPSLVEYRSYRITKNGSAPDLPSDALIRTALGGWGKALELVRRELERS